MDLILWITVSSGIFIAIFAANDKRKKMKLLLLNYDRWLIILRITIWTEKCFKKRISPI